MQQKLTLYAQSVRHLYMSAICKSGQNINMLDLGLLYQKVSHHIQRIVEDPSFLVEDSITWEIGTMDGKISQLSKTIEAVQQLAFSLPHFKAVLVAFFKGALTI
jgi:hypothetical protein